MVAWSGILHSAGRILNRKQLQLVQNSVNNNAAIKFDVRKMSGHARIFQIQPSRWMWDKTKDLVHLYVIVAAIPIFTVITLANIFVGPATLMPIPEGYHPKEWEYHRSPITRFLQRYLMSTDQMEYEKYCHFIWNEQEVMKCRELEQKVKALMAERKDYQAHYYLPYTTAVYTRRMSQKEKDQRELYSGP